MRTDAHAAQASPFTRVAARQAMGAARDNATRATFLRSWLAQHTQFKADPDNLELVRTAVEQLARIARGGVMRGDCDDVATLGAALALAGGLQPRFVVLGFTGPDAPYSHVYTDVLGGAVNLDVTRQPSSPRATRVAVMEV
jgi:transglutaminase-like putative cysteine protease